MLMTSQVAELVVELDIRVNDVCMCPSGIIYDCFSTVPGSEKSAIGYQEILI